MSHLATRPHSIADIGARIEPALLPSASPEQNLILARTLMRAGRVADALDILLWTEAENPHWPRTWELRVLQEACRQALDAAATPRTQKRSRRLRAAQILLFEGTTIDDITANLTRLKRAGVDSVFIRVFQNHGDRSLLRGRSSPGSGVYFRTTAAPVLTDYLSDIIPICRRLGLAVFAWMTTLRSDWLLSARPGLAELFYDADTGQVLPSRSLNVFHPQVRAHLLTLYRDLAEYDLDGILFQDDLALRTKEGFSPEAIAAYLDDGGESISPDALFRLDRKPTSAQLFSPVYYRPPFWYWAAWKNRRLLQLAGELMDAAREVRPGLRFALNLYYETVLNPRMSLAWYSQDLGLAQSYPFDYYALMGYHRQMKKELSLSTEGALETLSTLGRRAVRVVGVSEKVIMKIQVLDWDTRQLLPRKELDRALAAASRKPGISLAFIRSAEDPPLDIIRKHFLPTQ